MAPSRSSRFIAFAIAVLCASKAFAGVQEYFCTVTQDFEIGEGGSVAAPKLGSLIGRTIAVSRSTGQIIVPYSAFFMSARRQFKVLAAGNAQNSFVTMGTEPAGGDGVFTLLLSVEEFAKPQKKPFLLSAGVRALAGTCE